MLTNTEIIRKTETGYKRASEIDDGQEWLKEIKQRIRKEKRVMEVVFLSPSRAKALLNANPENRRVQSGAVETYAKDISSGRWVFNGEPIIIAETGEMNDGQHRCEAVVLAGKGIEVLLVAGVSRATRTTVDMGKARSPADFLHMHGVPYATVIAAAAQMLLVFEEGRMMGSKKGVSKTNNVLTFGDLKPTKQEVLTFARANLADFQRAIKAVDPGKASAISTFSRFVGALCIIARRSKDWDAAIEFISSVVNGDNLKSKSPEYIVREKLIAERSNRIGQIAFLEIVVRGWNMRRSGKWTTRLSVSGFVPEVAR